MPKSVTEQISVFNYHFDVNGLEVAVAKEIGFAGPIVLEGR